MTSGGARYDKDKPINEYNVIVGLPTLGNERKEFRNWKDKVKSALTQAKDEYEELMSTLTLTGKECSRTCPTRSGITKDGSYFWTG